MKWSLSIYCSHYFIKNSKTLDMAFRENLFFLVGIEIQKYLSLDPRLVRQPISNLKVGNILPIISLYNSQFILHRISHKPTTRETFILLYV